MIDPYEDYINNYESACTLNRFPINVMIIPGKYIIFPFILFIFIFG